MKINKLASVILIASSVSFLSACSDSDDPVTVEYEVTLHNLSSDQPMSPLAISLHGDSFKAWSVGSVASSGLEVLAESGDTSLFLSAAEADGVYSVQAGNGLILPGESDLVTITSIDYSALNISLASMLVNTVTAINKAPEPDCSTATLAASIILAPPDA